MHHVLYHGQDRAGFVRLREELPSRYRLRMCSNRDDLRTELGDGFAGGLILPMCDPAPSDLDYLRYIVGMPLIAGVVVTAARMSVQQAVCCMRLGAYDCLAGYPDGEILGTVLDRMLCESAAGVPPAAFNSSGIVGRSRKIRELMDQMDRCAALEVPVLVTGETGSGKELIARAIHDRSPRRSGPFTAVNCAAYSDDLVGSELFGSTSGAFTGSIDRPGLFESSRGGTVFLDEVGDLSLQGQACLLRVLEEKTVRRLGSLRPVSVDVRVVAATNRPLRDLMSEKLFRSDLFYRLNILGLTVPPLRQRPEDIAPLARHCLAGMGSRQRLDPAAVAVLTAHSWPGNIRELQSVILKAGLNARNGTIRAEDVSSAI